MKRHLAATMLLIGWILASTTWAADDASLRILARDPAGHGMVCQMGPKTILFMAGTPEQMGAAHGRLMRPKARLLTERVLYMVGGVDSIHSGTWFLDRMAEIHRRTLPHIPKRFLTECDALAEAAGLSQQEGRYANLFPERFHCSGVAVRGKATSDGRVLHARVLDYMRDINLQDSALVAVFIPEGYHTWMSLGYAGFIGTVTAMNEHGLAVGEMGGGGEGDWDGMPMSLLLREIMERASTVEEALEILRETPRTCEYYYVISDKSRAMVAVYATPKELTVLQPGQQHPRLPFVPEDTVLISGPGRAQTLSERLQQHYGKLDVATMIETIKRPVSMASNLHDAVFSPETLEMWFADAGRHTPACDEPYAHCNLGELVQFYRTAVEKEQSKGVSREPEAKKAASQGQAKRPNIVFLLTDDQRWDTLGCMGNKIIQTPNIDQLANQGVVFDRCFVTTSICMTNRACIFSGQYAARHGICDFQTGFTPAQLEQTYPARLKTAGYHVGFIGKWGVGPPPQGLFDYDKSFPGQGKYFQKIGGKTVHLNEVMGDQAIEFLSQTPKDRPFCLSVSFKAPHAQDGDPRQFLYEPRLESLYQDATIPPAPLSDPAFFAALPEFLKTSENRVRWQIRFATPEMYQQSVKGYYRLITGVDDVVGRIVKKLQEAGVADNTIIVYTGDNGFYLGERGLAGKWYGHEVSIRVPLVIYDPRLPAKRRGTRDDSMVLSIDLAPTMLAMAGAEAPATMQGESLLPLVQGDKTPWRNDFFYEHLFRHAKIPCSEGVRDQRYKYIRFLDVDPPYEELYDLAADPDEAHNLASSAEHTAALARMRQKWNAWREQAK